MILKAKKKIRGKKHKLKKKLHLAAVKNAAGLYKNFELFQVTDLTTTINIYFYITNHIDTNAINEST